MAMAASLRSLAARRQIQPRCNYGLGALAQAVISSFEIYSESQMSMPPCFVQARFRSLVLVKKPSWQRAEECGWS
jgi:hypothetical protein